MYIKQYQATRVKDGSTTHGYAARSTDGRVFILVPGEKSLDVHEVDESTMVEWHD